MLASAMVGCFPFWINNRTLSDLDNAIAGHESYLARRVYQLDMRPLVTVMMNIIRYFRKQDAFLPKYTMGFAQKGRERVCKRVLVLFGRANYKSETSSKVFLVVFALIGNVRWVVHYDIKARIPKWHRCVVGHQSRAVTTINIHSHHRALTTLPEPTAIHSRIEYLA